MSPVDRSSSTRGDLSALARRARQLFAAERAVRRLWPEGAPWWPGIAAAERRALLDAYLRGEQR